MDDLSLLPSFVSKEHDVFLNFHYADRFLPSSISICHNRCQCGKVLHKKMCMDLKTSMLVTGDHTLLMEKNSITSTLAMVMVGMKMFECLPLILMQVSMPTFPTTLFQC